MLILETLRIALGALRSNKIRAILTMLGIIIGVAAVITMMAVGQGAKQAIEDRIVSMGLDRLSVSGGSRVMKDGTRRRSPLTPDDARALAREMASASAVVPEATRTYQLKYRNRNAELQVNATVPEYFIINDATISAGRYLTEGESENRQFVAVITTDAAEELGATQAIVGEEIRIQGITFTVVGVVELATSGSNWRRPPDVFIPLSTAENRLSGGSSVQVSVKARSEEMVTAAAEEVERILRRAHRLRPDEPNDFRLFNRLDLAETFAATARTFGMLLASIAAVSLVVGGIGIMNIMLVSVTERTREIGIRKAIGARRSTILTQFLLEAVVLCALGGVMGILLGTGAAQLLASRANWSVIVTPQSVLLAVTFSVAIGVFFGMYPAARAARLDPIEALRHE